MDHKKTGALIRKLRTAKGLTQRALAERLHVSDKAVSKWERGAGCPDISLLSALAEVLGASLESLLDGQADAAEQQGGNMKKTLFYVCPDCGNLLTASAETTISCCGKRLAACAPRKAAPDDRLTVEPMENDYCISSAHEMTKEHYISFVALLTGDTLLLRRLYPEWDMQTRLPAFARHGTLLWYCTQHGLQYQLF
ncbi:MAG: helix-turn-helix domain-containing protein [Agathobaculum sp.]|jgi:transcriptional regulator with XRE-family HTH domain|uniref:helix-turn-helix domain-containing protein n=1 Tax=Agathobaculum sp. TaxID=2048138 RepID=UPI003D94C3D5